MAGRIIPGPNQPTVTDLQAESYVLAADGKPALAVVNTDGSSIAGGGGGGGAVTVADGDDVAEGATTDSAVTAGSTGSVSGKLRTISSDISSIKANQTNGTEQVQGTIASGATDSGNPVKIGGRLNTTRPTLTDGQRGDAQLDSRGNIGVALYGAGSTTGAAATASGADGVSNSTAGLNMYTLPRVYNGTTWDSARGAAGAVAAGTGTTAVSLAPTTAQLGLTIFSNTALSNTVTAVKASAGRLNWYNVYNPNASVVYLQIFNKTTGTVTLGTTTPDISIGIPANSGWDGEALMSLNWSTAISIAATTTPTGSTAPGSAVVVNLGYI